MFRGLNSITSLIGRMRLSCIWACNILRTPHIAKQVVDVFTHLNLDFVAVGGVQFCCGIVWDKFDGPKKGSQVSDRTVTRLEDYQPKQVVMWCPSCNVHFKDIVIGRDDRQPAFAITHTPQFLAEMAKRGALPWKQAVPCKVALHTHVGRTGHEEGERRARNDRESAAALLRSVPGVEVIDEVQAPPDLDYDCGAASLRLPPAQMQETRTTLLSSLRHSQPGRHSGNNFACLSPRVVPGGMGGSESPQLHLYRG